MEVIGIFRSERYKDRHNRFPRVRALRKEPVAADLTRESLIGLASPHQLYPIRRPIRRNYRGVEETHMLCQPGDHKIGVHFCDLLRRHTFAGFCQHFEPYAEPIGIELLVHAWLGGTPQIEIKDARELLGRRQHQQLAAILESAALNDSVKQLGLQSRDNVLEVRRSENASEHGAAVLAFSWRWTFEVFHVISGSRPLQSLDSR